MARRYDSEDSRRRILSACVKLFIEKGYHETTIAEIIKAADVTNGTFYNIFRTKDGVLLDLTEFMFANQFEMAGHIMNGCKDPVKLYAVETSIQITLAELNEKLREVYVEAYSNPKIAEYIYRQTSSKLSGIFAGYLPGYTESDFYELEVGSSGIMRGYMSRPCDKYFTLDRKLERFLEMSLRAYNVPENVRVDVMSYIQKMDICATANAVMQKLFNALAMKYEFELKDNVGLN